MRRFVLALLIALLAQPAWAESPIEVTADTFVVDQAKSDGRRPEGVFEALASARVIEESPDALLVQAIPPKPIQVPEEAVEGRRRQGIQLTFGKQSPRDVGGLADPHGEPFIGWATRGPERWWRTAPPTLGPPPRPF